MSTASGVGLRDQRLRVYAHSDAGEDGFARPIFTYQNTYWGRLDIVTSAEQIAPPAQQHADYRFKVKATFDYRATIPEKGLIKINDEVYFIRGVVPIRALWRKEVALERVSTDAFATFELFEGEDVNDGLHLVDPASS